MILQKGEISQSPEAKNDGFKLLQVLVKFVPEFAVYKICMFLGAYVNIQRILLKAKF